MYGSPVDLVKSGVRAMRTPTPYAYAQSGSRRGRLTCPYAEHPFPWLRFFRNRNDHNSVALLLGGYELLGLTRSCDNTCEQTAPSSLTV